MAAFQCRRDASGKARCEPGWTWSPPPLDDYDLWYVMEGKGELVLNREKLPAAKGACFLVRPGDRVRGTQHPEHRLTVIHIHFTPNEQAEADLPESRHVKFDDTALPETCLQRIVDLLLRQEERAEEEVDLLMRLVLLHMQRAERGGDAALVSTMHKQLVHKVMDEIRDRSDSRVSVSGLAASVGVSPRHLSQLFTQYAGCSLRAYLTRSKLERARFLLAETTMNITEVASALGFSDIYHFSKMFKARYGAPPSRYRYKGRQARSHGAPPAEDELSSDR